MSLQAFEIEELIYRHIKNELTDDEHQALQEWVEASDENRKLFDELVNENTWTPGLTDISFYASRKGDAKKKFYDSLLMVAPVVPVKKIWVKWVAAAAVVGVVGTGAVYMLTQKREVVKVTPAVVVNDVPPGGEKAVLTLADGSTVVLDGLKNGVIGVQGNAEVVKKDGEVVYDVKNGKGEVSYNTLATPRGGTFKVTLPDGSKAWLNAASSIKYPVVFVGEERKVEVTGEVYFEVEKDMRKPFRVSVMQGKSKPKAEVEVLGTHFNVNAYEDEEFVRTTLLEGKIRILNGFNEVLLKRGQQASFIVNGSIDVFSHTDLEEIIAWKNGAFQFSRAPIESIMRQIKRWYDVDVIYDGVVTDQFYVNIPRAISISKLLISLEKTGYVHFELRGRTIVVRP